MVLSIPLYILKKVIIMIEIAYSGEKGILRNKPQEVQETILDTEYGANRNKYEDDGGYVVVVEKEDFKEIKDKTHIECDNVIAEYVDKIVCSNGEIYTNSLILCNNYYAISYIVPLELTPQNLKDYTID